MFILYGLLAGFAAGLALGGRPGALAELRLRWIPLILAGFVVQAILFWGAVSDRVGALGPMLYVGSTALVFAAVLRNCRLPGLPLVAAGAAGNLAAIIANGGYMPASQGALAAVGRVLTSTYSNSAVIAHPALEPLTDIFGLPRWIPLSNVFSIGDICIATGGAVVVAWAMWQSRTTPLGEGSSRPVVPEHTGNR
ncbi:MAG: DUF5317 family protein [Candidatus Limnocylindrales bacterium]|jgi:hypothetical protein